MIGKLYPVHHQLLILKHTRPNGNLGSYSEEWTWEVYTSTFENRTHIRCEYVGVGRNVKIPWFETEEIDAAPIIKEKCIAAMMKTF